MLEWRSAKLYSRMSRPMSQTSEDTPTTQSWTADFRIGGGRKYSCPVEFAIAPISAVPVRLNALAKSIAQGFVSLNMVNLCTSIVTEAEKMQMAALGIICRECH